MILVFLVPEHSLYWGGSYPQSEIDSYLILPLPAIHCTHVVYEGFESDLRFLPEALCHSLY